MNTTRRTAHAGCSHDATPTARAACRVMTAKKYDEGRQMDNDSALYEFISAVRSGPCPDWTESAVVRYARRHSNGHPSTRDFLGAAEYAVRHGISLATVVNSTK